MRVEYDTRSSLERSENLIVVGCENVNQTIKIDN